MINEMAPKDRKVTGFTERRNQMGYNILKKSLKNAELSVITEIKIVFNQVGKLQLDSAWIWQTLC